MGYVPPPFIEASGYRRPPERLPMMIGQTRDVRHVPFYIGTQGMYSDKPVGGGIFAIGDNGQLVGVGSLI